MTASPPSGASVPREGARFVAFGAFNSLLTYGIYCALVTWLHPQIAYAIVYAFGIALAYAGNSTLVFRTPMRLATAAAYPGLYAVQYLATAGLLHALTAGAGLGPRVAAAVAMALVVPLSYAFNRALLGRSGGGGAAAGSSMSVLRAPRALLLLAPLAVAAWLYAPGFGGFWIGDDRANLYLMHEWSQQGELASRALAQFTEGIPSQGAFYRPMMMASLAANHALFGTAYAGWYAFGFALHLANVLLVGLLVLRWGAAARAEAGLAAALAALAFGLSPFLAEGVYWVSARSDAGVTFATLLGLYLWTGPRADSRSGWAMALPLLLLPALGFKESAAVLPLQALLLALALPGRTGAARVSALAACFALVAGFFLLRAALFGNPFEVYRASGPSVSLVERLSHAALSVSPWWEALGRATPAASAAYPVLLAAATAALALALRGPAARLAIALAAAAGGLALATFANLGSLSSTGEGGRLAYGPVAWFSLALGLAAATPQTAPGSKAPREVLRQAGLALLFAAVAAGTLAAHAITRHAFEAQRRVMEMSAGIPAWARSHPGLTMLVIPENDAFVVVNRNGQGGLVLPPLQDPPLLDRVIPTLPREIELRREQFSLPGATWPSHVACWSVARLRIEALAAPPLEPRSDWIGALRRSLAACGM